MNKFIELAKIDVGSHIEKKNGLSYLSWAWAVDQLMRHDPEANWTFNEPTIYPDGTMMVSCTVNAFGKPITMHLPVMDHKNRAIPNPGAFEINKNMMRCLVKAIACHGLGLYIYAGEDIPPDEEGAKTDPAHAYEEQHLQSLRDAAMAGMIALQTAFKGLPASDHKKALWAKHGDALKHAAELAMKEAA
jgi:hypothetical protein